jgi:hypothetical protein
MNTRTSPESVNALSNEELLYKHDGFQRWFGDDFCISLPEEKDFEEAAVYRAEVLRRMNAAAQSPVGMDWEISEETKRHIDEIERNIRDAPQNIARSLSAPESKATSSARKEKRKLRAFRLLTARS